MSKTRIKNIDSNSLMLPVADYEAIPVTINSPTDNLKKTEINSPKNITSNNELENIGLEPNPTAPNEMSTAPSPNSPTSKVVNQPTAMPSNLTKLKSFLGCLSMFKLCHHEKTEEEAPLAEKPAPAIM